MTRSQDSAVNKFLSLLVWGLAGALFGAMFVILRALLDGMQFGGWQALVGAACIAGMTTAAFYSAMAVALVGATAGVLASIGYLMLAHEAIDLAHIAGVSAIVGLVVGMLLDWGARANAGALGVTLTGLLAGTAAGLFVAIALTLTPTPSTPIVEAAGVVALVGVLFQLNVQWLVEACGGSWIARIGSPLVAALIAAIIGMSIWITVGIVAMPGTEAIAVNRLLAGVPAGLMGGLIGGLVAGVVLQTLGVRIDRHMPDCSNC